MATIYTQEQLDKYLDQLRQQYGRLTYSPVAGQKKVDNPDYDPDVDDDADATLQAEVKRWIAPNGHVIEAIQLPGGRWQIQADEPPDPSKGPAAKSPDQQRTEKAQADKAEADTAAERELARERSYNQSMGRGYITHAQYAQQQAEQERLETARQATERQRVLDERAEKNREATNELSQQQLQETIRHNKEGEKKTPQIVGSPTDTARSVSVFDPNTGGLTRVDNPAYDEIKDTAERERQRIMTEIAQRKMSLDEGIQSYTEWFNSNVKVPFMQAEEARAQAKEQRDALDSEERRRQFASDFSLRKATLGQQAGEASVQNELALLPYRAGPNEAAHMADAINSLAAGGVPGGPSAGAGVHFEGGDFQFARPDFKAIAAEGVKAAIGHLTDYKPSGQSYSTGNYSGINLPGANVMASAPSAAAAPYQYGGMPIDSDQT